MSYATDLYLPIPLFNSTTSINNIERIAHKKLDVAACLNPELISYFNNLSLRIDFAETFYMEPFNDSVIHCDTNTYTDIAKINFVFGGNDSTMNWYMPNDPILKNTNKSSIGSNYRKYDKNEVTLIHQHCIKFPTLVQAGIPHNVTTFKESRMCVSLFLMNVLTKTYISFSEGMQLFKECAILH